MRANVLHAIGDLRYEAVHEPLVRSGNVLVKVESCGICGSDVDRVYKTGTYSFPRIIGHEFAGTVVDVCNPKDHNYLGARVSVFPLIPCKTCECCVNGLFELCGSYDYLGSRSDGGFAEFVSVPSWNLHRLPDAITFEEAAMYEPAAVAAHALRQIGKNPRKSILIIGPGTIGMIASQIAVSMGYETVILAGRSAEKLDFAASHFHVLTHNINAPDMRERLDEITGRKGVDVVIEGTGAGSCLALAIEYVKRSGILVAMGNPHGDISLSRDVYWKILRKQLRVVGTWNSSFGHKNDDWKYIEGLILSGQLNLESLITHRFAMKDLRQGLEMMKSPNRYVNKVMINAGGQR